jgi:hypothetical protein
MDGTGPRQRSVDMSSLDIAASPPIRRDETVQIALLLALVGGYLDAFTWIIHGVMANAQTATLFCSGYMARQVTGTRRFASFLRFSRSRWVS